MDFVRKFSVLKYIVICLTCLSVAEKADDLLCPDANEPECRAIYDAGGAVWEFQDSARSHFDADRYSFTLPDAQCPVPRQTNIANTSRTSAQAKRPNLQNIARHGFILAKPGKSMNQYTTSLFFVSILNFPSGLTEANHRLISLGKLII